MSSESDVTTIVEDAILALGELLQHPRSKVVRERARVANAAVRSLLSDEAIGCIGRGRALMCTHEGMFWSPPRQRIVKRLEWERI